MKYLLLMSIILLIPYNIFPEGICGALLSIAACIVLIGDKRSEIKVDGYIFFSLLALCILGLFSFLFNKNINLFFDGFFVYIAMLLFYMVFIHMDSEKLLKYFTYTAAVSAGFFIVFQGLILDKRIDGNFSYANTYGLVLLICLYMNEMRQKDRFYPVISWVSILGVLFTGSRNTFIYLAIFIVLCFIIKPHKEENYIMINTFTAVLLYVFFKFWGIGMVFIMPVFYIVLYYIYEKVSFGVKKYMNAIFAALIFTMLLVPSFLQKDINGKINNISLDSGTVQERIVYYEDALKHIFNNPLGSGMNTFVYKQYGDQSAFYDVKYIHNSVLQVFYDLGVFGVLAFMAVFFYALYSILTSSTDEDRIFKTALFVTVYLHSLLDFDFSFVTVAIIAVMLVSFSCKKDNLKINKLFKNILVYFILTLSLYVCIFSTFSLLGDFYSEKDVDKSIYFYNLNRAVTIKNPDVYVFMAQSYNKKNMREKCLENLKLAEQLNPEDPRIKTDIAFTYEKAGDIQNTIKYYDSVLKIQKYYPEIYRRYYTYLNDVYKNTQDHKYKIKMDDLRKLYYKNYRSLNKRSEFLKNQMSGDFSKDVSGKF